MPTVFYPTNTNFRESYLTNAAGNKVFLNAIGGRCINFKFDVTDAIVSIGTYATITYTITPAAISAGTAFQLCGQTIVVDNTIATNTNTKVNFASTVALTNAGNLKAMILSNSFFAGNVEVTVTASGSNATVVIKWLSKGVVSSFTPTSAPTPYTVTAVNGTGYDEKDYYTFVYRVMFDVAGKATPITDYIPISLTHKADETPVSPIEIEVNDFLKPYLTTYFKPYCNSLSFRENNFRALFWLEFSYIEKDATTCDRYYRPFATTTPEWVYNTVFQEEDKGQFSPYVSSIAGVTRNALTKAPDFCVCPTTCGHIWIIADDKERFNLVVTQYRHYVEYYNGTTWVTLSTVAYGNLDGVYMVAAYPGSLPTPIPAPYTDYQIKFVRIVGGVESTITIANFTINRTCCCDFTITFKEDLGSYTPLCFTELTEINLEGEQVIECLPCVCREDDQQEDYGAMLGTGGKQVVSSEFYRKYSVRSAELPNTDKARAFIEAFIMSPEKYMTFPKGGVTYFRNIFIDGGSTLTYSNEDVIYLEFDFYAHKSLNNHVN